MTPNCVHLSVVLNQHGRWHCPECNRSFLPSGDTAVEQSLVRMRALLIESKREHLTVEGDCWYSCPKSGHICNDARRADPCDCGADAWNAKVDAELARVGETVTDAQLMRARDAVINRLRLVVLKFGDHIRPCPGRPCECGFLQEWRAAALPESIADVIRISKMKPYIESGDHQVTYEQTQPTADELQAKAVSVLNRKVLRLPEGIDHPGSAEFVDLIVHAAALKAVAAIRALGDSAESSQR